MEERIVPCSPTDLRLRLVAYELMLEHVVSVYGLRFEGSLGTRGGLGVEFCGLVGGFRKLGVPYLGVLITKILLFRVLY